ncbi:esterase FE4-like [Schistocerca cancellata]|uniref:esterase FE4-like n=1 Tax=Schistocerca cancellata TaxID=274614 RepID=UPI002117A31E|nr:esterase FE4-like [Schistocerca cancellata]
MTMAALRLFVLLNLCLIPVAISAVEYLTVDTEEGTLRGQMGETYTGKPMYRFEGIPYAEPPVGDLRFQPPVQKSAWTGVKDVLKKGTSCTQYSNGKTSGSEDCLYLSVFGPGTPSRNGTLKNVMVFIHGGCFTSGSGNARPQYFVDLDVIVIHLNYRLGLLGFLSTGDEVVPGNMGLKDQTEALRWVQRNIEAFGGDPQKVTIYGQSAGSASVHYHVLSPLSKGLFKSAIAMSGSASNAWAFTKNATDRALRFAKYLGYTGKTSTDLLNFLKTVKASTLVKNITVALSEEDSLSLFSCVWTPTAEPEHDGAFLTEQPWTLVAEGRYNLVPFMAGDTDLERLKQTQKGGALYTEEQVSNLNENFDEIVGCDLRLPTREEQLKAAASIKEFYYNGSDITVQDNYTTCLLETHRFFVEGVDAAIRSMARYSSNPVYYYQFSFVGTRSTFPHGPGAAHNDDVKYMHATDSLDPDSAGGIIRSQMISMWTNFAKYDNPTPEETSILTETWKEYDESSPYYLEINRPLQLKTNLYEPYMTFWHNLLP